MFICEARTANLALVKSENMQASYIGDFGNILTISLKAHYYPAYQVGADSSD